MLTSIEIDLIKKAYKRCYGLKELINVGTVDATVELSKQTGLRATFIVAHMEEIKAIGEPEKTGLARYPEFEPLVNRLV